MIVIDGSRGEGGGQILRSALALSMIQQIPFRIERVRAARRRPGLMRQHLTAVQAAASVSGAEISGAFIGSEELLFSPGPVQPGNYAFAVGSAGSTGLVFQSLLPALACAGGLSSVELSGGTHNPLAPTFDFLTRALFPLLQRMNVPVSGGLARPGYYPAGGGKVTYQVGRVESVRPLELMHPGSLRRRSIVVQIAELPDQVAQRELAWAVTRLGWSPADGSVQRVTDSAGPGNVVSVALESENLTEVFTGFGEKGIRAERVGQAVAQQALEYLNSGAAIGPYLADQLVLWLALAGGGSFSTQRPSKHTLSQCEVVRTFLGVDVRVVQTGATWTVRVG